MLLMVWQPGTETCMYVCESGLYVITSFFGGSVSLIFQDRKNIQGPVSRSRTNRTIKDNERPSVAPGDHGTDRPEHRPILDVTESTCILTHSLQLASFLQ